LDMFVWDFSVLFFSSFTLSAYLKVFRVCSTERELGETHPIIIVLQFPMNESFKTSVSLLARNGVYLLS